MVGDAVDIASAVLGKDLLTGEHIGGVGVAATVVGTLLGSGKLAREGVGQLIKSATDNPGGWKTVGSFTEAATNRKVKGGTSIQTIVENQAGDRLVRHTVVDKSGKVIDDHYREVFKPRDVDSP